MGKYSKKVLTWGGLPEFVEHRNKKGDVTARTEYFEGKAYTTRVPRYKESASTRAATRRHQRAVNDLFVISPGAKVFLAVATAVILLIAGIAWAVNQVLSALTGFWPVFGGILSWVALAGWAASIVLLGVTVWKRGVSPESIVYASLQGAALVVVALAAIVPLTGFDPYMNSAFASWVSVSALAAVLISVVSGVVFAFRYGVRWLWFAPAALVVAALCAFFTPLGAAGAVLVLVAALVRYNWYALTD